MSITYKMTFVCDNCGKHFDVNIEKGERAKGKGGECPYCGASDYFYGNFTYYRPGNNPFAEGRK